MCLKKFLKKILIGFCLSIFLFIGLASASMWGEENVMLGKILVEDIQQTFHLKDIISFASAELKTLNQRYGYEKWINKGLNTIKDYGFLEHIKTDDYILGTFQNDFGNLGLHINADDYKLKNIDDWVDQVWMKSPEIINIETKYPGGFSDWQFQTEYNLPATFYGSSTMRSMVNRKSAMLSYKQALWNIKFNKKMRLRVEDLLIDSKGANPGEANRITAQASALQNIQLAKVNTTQSSVLRLMAEKRLNKMIDDDITSINIQNTFTGMKRIIKSVPTFGK